MQPLAAEGGLILSIQDKDFCMPKKQASIPRYCAKKLQFLNTATAFITKAHILVIWRTEPTHRKSGCTEAVVAGDISPSLLSSLLTGVCLAVQCRKFRKGTQEQISLLHQILGELCPLAGSGSAGAGERPVQEADVPAHAKDMLPWAPEDTRAFTTARP